MIDTTNAAPVAWRVHPFSFQSYKNGTLMFTIKKGDRHA